MKLRTVDPKIIKVPEVRVRARFDEETLKVFQETIKAVGQITPIICFEVGEDIVLSDGGHRLAEAISNGESGIKVVVLPGDMIDVMTKNIMLDHARGKTPVSDMVVVIKSLTQDYNLVLTPLTAILSYRTRLCYWCRRSLLCDILHLNQRGVHQLLNIRDLKAIDLLFSYKLLLLNGMG